MPYLSQKVLLFRTVFAIDTFCVLCYISLVLEMDCTGFFRRSGGKSPQSIEFNQTGRRLNLSGAL